MTSRRHLYTVAPNAPFLPSLADRILDGTLLHGWDRSGPFWLSDVTIILPTRRSRLRLAEIFAERLGGAALLPDIRTFGGENAEEEPFLPPVDAPPPPAAVSNLERRLILSHLVGGYAGRTGSFASPPNAAEIIRLADSLGEMIDDLVIEDVPFSALEGLVEGDLAGNWQDILAFLRIALEAWPKMLAERGKVDAASARNARLVRQAATAPALYGERPVIAAGSTGSVPATATLLKAIAALPRGAVVVPGLDTTLSAEDHERLIEGATLQGHPQYALARLLRALGAGIADVEELAEASARTGLVRAALATAEDTGRWSAQRGEVDVAAALEGVSIIAAPNVDLEARAIALAARQAIADGKTVGIVTRDQTLARRIAAELSRHGLEPDDPAGTPLYQSAAGRLCRQVLTAVTGQFAPVDLIALLSNRAVSLGLDRREIWKRTRAIDLKSRRMRPNLGLAGYAALADGRADIADLLVRLEGALAPLIALVPAGTAPAPTDAPRLAAALLAAVEAVTDRAPLEGLAELRSWAGDLAAAGNAGAPFPLANLDTVVAALMAGQKVPPGERRRDDIHIWGELEARLQSPDLLILAGVNEDIWPAPADPGPWLSRKMRLDLELEPPERQQGQAAHDFAMALGNAEVIIAFAERIGTSPALPSRLVQRLDAFVEEAEAKAMRARGARWLADAHSLDHAGQPKPAGRPEPNPPAAIRPKSLSVTEIETLVRSPYDIYAKRVLRLRRLDPLGTEPGARDRGTMIHGVFERFVREGLDIEAPDAAARLLEMAREEFASLESIAERRDIWLRRFARTIEMFLAFERERDAGVLARLAEVEGKWALPNGFTLTGKADRIDLRRDGLVEIIDFKTGGVPQAKDMTNYDAPQLPLEAAMAEAGAFPGVPRGSHSAALTYIKIGLGPKAFQVISYAVRKDMELMEAVETVSLRLQGHVDRFLLRDGQAMVPNIRPRPNSFRRYRGDYDHLARTDEWTLTAGVDDP